MSKNYKEAGVDKEEGYRSVSLMKEHAAKTADRNVLGGLGSFASLYALPAMEEPVLVSGTDGVGTKLEIALKHRVYDTVGKDCFAMCANDVLCHGAKPLFFLDYLACGKLEAEVASEIVKGISEACTEAQCSLVGGETAEMPGFYREGDYDVAGFCVGAVERKEIVDGSKVREGDLLLGIESSGVHSNGFSLVRMLFKDMEADFEGSPLYKTLLTPTTIYVTPVLKLLGQIDIRGMAHITGGGLPENLPRTIPEGLGVRVEKSSIPVPSIFKLIREQGVGEEEMWNTFNMGTGFVLVIDPGDVQTARRVLEEEGLNSFVTGSVVKIKNPEEKFCFV